MCPNHLRMIHFTNSVTHFLSITRHTNSIYNFVTFIIYSAHITGISLVTHFLYLNPRTLNFVQHLCLTCRCYHLSFTLYHVPTLLLTCRALYCLSLYAFITKWKQKGHQNKTIKTKCLKDVIKFSFPNRRTNTLNG